MKPYRKSNKNDYLDAEAIAEAVTRKNLRFVPIKTEDQLDIQGLHRVRERLVHNRTEVINQIRGFLLERGVTFNRGPLICAKRWPLCWKMQSRTLHPNCAACSLICGSSGGTCTARLIRSAMPWKRWPRAMRRAGVCERFLELARWSGDRKSVV